MGITRLAIFGIVGIALLAYWDQTAAATDGAPPTPSNSDSGKKSLANDFTTKSNVALSQELGRGSKQLAEATLRLRDLRQLDLDLESLSIDANDTVVSRTEKINVFQKQLRQMIRLASDDNSPVPTILSTNAPSPPDGTAAVDSAPPPPSPSKEKEAGNRYAAFKSLAYTLNRRFDLLTEELRGEVRSIGNRMQNMKTTLLQLQTEPSVGDGDWSDVRRYPQTPSQSYSSFNEYAPLPPGTVASPDFASLPMVRRVVTTVFADAPVPKPVPPEALDAAGQEIDRLGEGRPFHRPA